jgi:uncharacterized protein (TIGR02588 family)
VRPDQTQGSPSDDGSSQEDQQGEEQGSGGKDSQKRPSQGKQDRQDKGGESGQGEKTGPTTTQWVVGIGSTLLVLALLAFVVYEAISGTDSPPVVVVRVERVLPVPGGYVVEVGAYNEGGTTASALQIEGTLKQDTVTVETSTATIQYVPAETEREAGLFFTKDPLQYKLEVRPLGYDRP